MTRIKSSLWHRHVKDGTAGALLNDEGRLEVVDDTTDERVFTVSVGGECLCPCHEECECDCGDDGSDEHTHRRSGRPRGAKVR